MLKKISECLNTIGIISDSIEPHEELMCYIEDSIVMISFIVEIEREFDIEIPDEYLLPDRISTFENLCDIITKLKYEQSNNI